MVSRPCLFEVRCVDVDRSQVYRCGVPHDVDSGRGLQNRIRDGEAEHCVSGVRNECSVIVDAVSVDGDPDGVPPISARYRAGGFCFRAELLGCRYRRHRLVLAGVHPCRAVLAKASCGQVRSGCLVTCATPDDSVQRRRDQLYSFRMRRCDLLAAVVVKARAYLPDVCFIWRGDSASAVGHIWIR